MGRAAWNRAGSRSAWRTSTRWSPAAFAEEDLVNDGWTEIIRNLLLLANYRRRRTFRTDHGAASAKRWSSPTSRRWSQIRARVDEIVEDPATAEALKPYYRQFCKRPCFHDDYLPTFNRDNVHPGGHRRQGRGAHHRKRRGGQRGGVRARLHRLRHRLRSRHRLHSAAAATTIHGRIGMKVSPSTGKTAPVPSTDCTSTDSRTCS